MRELEVGILAYIEKLNRLEIEDMENEPEHRKMISELMNADFIAKLPNQVMRDDALENYIYNNEQFSKKHMEYLKLKLEIKNCYRRYRYYEECMKNRRTELNTFVFKDIDNKSFNDDDLKGGE